MNYRNIYRQPFCVILLFIATVLDVSAYSKVDTLKLKEAIVTSKRTGRIQPSARVTVMDTNIIKSNSDKSLAEVLSDNSVIHIKSLGQGALATASFRGTSSSHTQVSWNGIVINSPIMESFDFSQIPIFFTDDISLSHGAGAFKYGSGALGGNVNFGNNLKNYNFDKDTSHTLKYKPKIKLLSEYGSNNTFTEGVSIHQRYGKLMLGTRIYYQQSDNDYKYLNKVYSKESFYERRKNADYKLCGAMQEADYIFNLNNSLSAVFWWQFDERNLPQPIIVDQSVREKQINRDYRTMIKYTKTGAASDLNISTAMLSDNMHYNKMFDSSLGDKSTTSNSRSFIINGNYNYIPIERFNTGIGINYRRDIVKSNNYTSNKITRNSFMFMAFAQYKFLNRIEAVLHGSGETIGKEPAFTYNIGINYTATDWMKIKLSNSYNHKFPSLNDRYWEPGGNPDLKAEKGFSYEATVSFSPVIGSFSINTELTYYKMDIDNWIMWIPTGNGYYWEPQNFKQVCSQGAEIRIETVYNIYGINNKLTFNYAYTNSVDKSERNDGTSDCQLPYIPKNKWNINYRIEYENIGASYSAGYTDIRFTTADCSYFTNAYTTHNAEAFYKLNLNKYGALQISLKISNILNTYYESTQYYPMPLRAITLGITWSL